MRPFVEYQHRLYEEKLVKEIMLSTAICVQELLMDDPKAREDEIFEFVESNFRQIIIETLSAEAGAEGSSCEEESEGRL